MPIYQINSYSKHIKVGVWKISETEKELIKLLHLKGFNTNTILQTQNTKRLQQWLATRLILSEFFKNATISYDDFGKPSLNNGWFISISHSNEFVAIIVNKNRNCGIDIEQISSKIERIKHKFLNPTDLKNVTSIDNLTLYWGAKEALYKYYGKKEVLFIEHLFIEDFSDSSDSFKGIINMTDLKTDLKMCWRKIEDYIIVYTL